MATNRLLNVVHSSEFQNPSFVGVHNRGVNRIGRIYRHLTSQASLEDPLLLYSFHMLFHSAQ